MTTATPIPERLKELDALTVDHGGHDEFAEGHCAMELVSYLAGEEHSAYPACASPVLTGFLVRLNDSLPDEARQQVKPYLPKVIGTRGDGKDQLRGWLASDWLIRTALPIWLDTAGAEESAAKLRELPEITAETIESTRPLVQRVRDEARKLRSAAREAMRTKVYDAVKKKLEDKGLSAADAADAADAAADAYADAYAAADAAAAAADAAAYAADAAAAAYAYAAGLPSLRAAVRKAVRAKVKETLEPKRVALLPSALELLDKMIDPVAAAA